MENAKILIVEDDSEVANIIQNILHNTGFNIPIVVSNGEAAISATKIFNPDLILMDIKLEGDIDGIKAAEKIKESHNIPIIFLTANSENDILKMASKTNPLAFIIKPFKANELIANVKNALLQREKNFNIKKDSFQNSKEIRKILNNSVSYIYTLEIKDKIHFNIKHSSACAYVTGYSIEEFNFNPNLCWEIVFKDDKQIFLENINKMLCKEFIEPFEYRIIRKDGSVRWVRNIPIPRHNADGELFSYDGLIEDITERKISGEFIKNILEAVDEGFVVIDKDYRIVSANSAFCKQVKIEPEIVFGRKCYEIFHNLSIPCCEIGIPCGVNHVFNMGTSCTADCHCHGDGENLLHVETKYYPLKDISGNIVSVIVTILDRTEKKKLEEQLFHAQKMEALGQFASTIAHDLNNYLAAMTTYAQILKTKMQKNSSLNKYVHQIILSLEKIAGMTRNLIAFGRKQAMNMGPINIFEEIKKSKNILSALVGDDISIEIIFKPSSSKYKEVIVNGDSDLLEQVFMNLAVNARDAMPDGGKIRIELSTEEKESNFIKSFGFLETQRFVLISFSDTGSGMDEETKSKIFEPFFTTKEAGKGTGLGLAIVYRIIKEHKGYIDVDSILGKGTTFKIYLPMIEQ